MKYFKEMLDLQDDFNKKVNKDWKRAGYDQMLASILELAEALDSTNWKWWKYTENDFQNFEVELVDVWHFIQSKFMETYSKEFLEQKFNKNWLLAQEIFWSLDSDEIDIKELIHDTKTLMFLVLNYDLDGEAKEDDILHHLFGLIIRYTTITDIRTFYKKYLVKNVLNVIRQNNGYKKGTYIKVWPYENRTAEDNVVAWDILNNYTSDVTFDRLLNDLQEYYNTIKK